MRHILGAKLSVEQKQTLENLQRFLQRQNRDIHDSKLLALLDWISTHVIDSTSLTSEALQGAVAPPLFVPPTAISSLPATAAPPPAPRHNPPMAALLTAPPSSASIGPWACLLPPALQRPLPNVWPLAGIGLWGTNVPLALYSPLPFLGSQNVAAPPSSLGLLGDTTTLPLPDTCQEPPAGSVAILPIEMITWDSCPESPYPSDLAPINIQTIQLYFTWNQGPGPDFTAYPFVYEQGQTAVYKDMD